MKLTKEQKKKIESLPYEEPVETTETHVYRRVIFPEGVRSVRINWELKKVWINGVSSEDWRKL